MQVTAAPPKGPTNNMVPPCNQPGVHKADSPIHYFRGSARSSLTPYCLRIQLTVCRHLADVPVPPLRVLRSEYAPLGQCWCRIGPGWLPIIRNNALVPRPGSSSTHFPCRRNLGVGRPSIYTAASGGIHPAVPSKYQQRALDGNLTPNSPTSGWRVRGPQPDEARPYRAVSSTQVFGHGAPDLTMV
jgi:hypothetical protein